jgi:hypothetical protein
MLEDGILTRISLSAGVDIRTASGIQVGDRAADVMAAHGAEAVTTPHKYQEAPAHRDPLNTAAYRIPTLRSGMLIACCRIVRTAPPFSSSSSSSASSC